MGGPVTQNLDDDIRQLLALALQTVEILASQNAVDSANRQRITLDAIAPSLILAQVNTVSTVSSVTNIAAIGGWDHRQFENPANHLFNSQISANLVFG